MASHRGWKICATVTGILFITILVVLVVLFLTVLKIKEPDIVARPVNLESYEVVVFPAIKFNVSVGILITVKNRNYGSFKYDNSTALISYRDKVIAVTPLKDGTIPSHKKYNITASMDILADKLLFDSNFLRDLRAGVLNFTSHTTVHGKGSLLKIFHKKATSKTDCNISIIVASQSVDSACTTSIKF
ncbi:late embryogenesis abundant protein At1g64065-like [Rosa rugosa]|uniref:late embryogenesis abundant protein At1g64065-like n=1 Tax=Rosa rugosa TaxID=74645 RepID=UPI002B414132|nr:late embryogenesis abundant protein At1g64065-like [Rosa rugosa]